MCVFEDVGHCNTRQCIFFNQSNFHIASINSWRAITSVAFHLLQISVNGIHFTEYLENIAWEINS